MKNIDKLIGWNVTIRQFVKFSIVGASGVIVNLSIFMVCIKFFYLHYLVAASLSFIFALTSNFFLNRIWTFQYGQRDFKTIVSQFGTFFLVSLVGYGINILVLYVLVNSFSYNKLLSQLISIVFATANNFLGSKKIVFKKKEHK